MVWAYKARTLKLINNLPFTSLQNCAEYFKVEYRAIKNNLDTELAVSKNGQLVYFFTSEISEAVKNKLLDNINKASHGTLEVWVYKKLNDQYTLLDKNQPFKSKLPPSKNLNINYKTINKYIDTNQCYNRLYFF